jgi:tRNA modification GTPase
VPITWVRNKIDLSQKQAKIIETADGMEVALSAKSGEGIELLKQHLKMSVGFSETGEGEFLARRRHLNALDRAEQHLLDGGDALEQHAASELLAEELRLAQQALGEITGEFTADDLLGRIFSTFCIGK